MKAKKVLSQVRWFKLTLLIIVLLALLFVYGKVSSLLKNGIKSGLESAFSAPVEVSTVFWSPFSISVKRIAVVDKNKPEYLFTLNNFKGNISFNHLIRKSFVLNDLNISITTGEKIPADKYSEYQKIISQKKEEKQAKSEKKKEEFTQKKQNIKAQIEKAFNDYLSKKEPEILAFKKQIHDISTNIDILKTNSKTTVDKIDKMKVKLQKLGKDIDETYKKKDLTKLLSLLKELNDTKKGMNTIKNEVVGIVKKAKDTKNDIVNTKNGIIAYTDNIRKNYKTIVMDDIGFFMGEIPSLSKIFVAKSLLDKFNKFYAIYKKINKFKEKHLKTNKKPKKKKIKRNEGKYYVFSLKEPNPKFWMKKGTIAINTGKMDFTGGLKNITSSNKEMGLLSSISLNGKKDNEEMKIGVFWDDEKFYGNIEGKNFPLKKMDLNVLTIEKANADYTFNYAFSPDKSFSLDANIKNVMFDKNSDLYNMAKDIKSFTLKTKAQNIDNKWKTNASSDLDKQIGDLLKKAFKKKKEEGIAYLDKKFNDWYKKNIPNSLNILDKDTDIIKSITDVSERQKTLDKLSSDLKKKANDYIDKLKKEKLKGGLNNLLK